MRSWLHALQAHLDKARRVGIQPTDSLTQIAASSLAINYTLVDDFYLARRLLCSRGEEYNCSNKVNKYLFLLYLICFSYKLDLLILRILSTLLDFTII